jgi:phenylalanyl-tRNA synthetase beta chain
MKILWSWLADHLKNVPSSPEEVCHRLTLSGTESTFTEAHQWAIPFRVARIESIATHPQAASLSLCTVDDGTGHRHIVVCGASNVRAGMLSIFALPGCILPGEKKPLEVVTLRGIKSFGMLCSAEELCIDDMSLPLAHNGEGILDISPHVAIGTSLHSLLPKDWLLELELTPNRGDLASHLGVARELSALGIGELVHSPLHPLPSALASYEAHIATDSCAQIYFCEMRNISQGVTPPLMRRRLAAINARLYFPCVDLTNYMAHDILRPLHIFDADDIVGSITIRQAKEGEEFQALDGAIHKLSHEDIVLADEEGILSLGGIMGALRGKCTSSSKRILIECAEFSSEAIARTGQRLQISSDARYRFERGLDPCMLEEGLSRAIHWISEQCHGTPTALFSKKQLPAKNVISFPYSLITTLGGATVARDDSATRLKKLGAHLDNEETDVVKVTPPSWRKDWQLPEDCVEEALRLNGYAEVTPCPLPRKESLPSRDPVGNGIPPLNYDVFWKTRRFFVSKGLQEVVTWSFVSPEHAGNFSQAPQTLKTINNPIASDLSVMRPSVIPGLLEIYQYHKRYGLHPHPIFEIGPRFADDQQETLAILFPMELAAGWPHGPVKSVSFYEFKSLIEAFLDSVGASHWEIRSLTPPWYHPGQSIEMHQEGRPIGQAGALHPRFHYPCWVAEIDLTCLAIHSRNFGYAVPALQPVSKDLSFQLPHDLLGGVFIEALIKEGAPELIDLKIVDLFHPENKPPCLSLRGTFQPKDQAFTQEQLHHLMDRLIQKAKSYGAELRGEWD